MKFTLKIDMDNNAFSVMPEYQIKRCLEIAATQITEGKTNSILFDANGNTVGYWEIQA